MGSINSNIVIQQIAKKTGEQDVQKYSKNDRKKRAGAVENRQTQEKQSRTERETERDKKVIMGAKDGKNDRRERKQ